MPLGKDEMRTPTGDTLIELIQFPSKRTPPEVTIGRLVRPKRYPVYNRKVDELH